MSFAGDLPDDLPDDLPENVEQRLDDLEARREQLERLAELNVPISDDAQRALNLLDEHRGGGQS